MDESEVRHIEESLPKVGRFQQIADDMLRGCRITTPCVGYSSDGAGGACALGAWAIAAGLMDAREPAICLAIALFPASAREAYAERYGNGPSEDFDMGRFTREQIAARIAAL